MGCVMDEGIVYLNGEFVSESMAKVSVFDRGFNGGEGVYDVTRTFGHKPFKLKEHIQRLYRSLKYTRIDCGLSPEEMERLSLEVLSAISAFWIGRTILPSGRSSAAVCFNPRSR